MSVYLPPRRPLSFAEAPSWVHRAVNTIIEDLCDRGLLGGEWERIDEQTQEDIRAEWRAILMGCALSK